MNRSRLPSLFLEGERQLNRLVIAAAALMLVVASVSALYQVFSRFVLEIPAHWSEPLVKVALIWMVYLGLMAGARTGTMIAVDFLLDKASGPLRVTLRIVIMISVMTLFAVLVYYGWQAVYMVRNQTIAGLGISASWVYAAIPVGAGCTALAAIAQFVDPHNKIDSAEAL